MQKREEATKAAQDEVSLPEVGEIVKRGQESLLNRRWLVGGGLMGLILQACSDAAFNGSKTSVAAVAAKAEVPPEAAPEDSSVLVEDQEIDPVVTTVSQDPAEAPLCRPIDNPKIDTSQVSLAASDKTPTAVFYGRQDSALLALLLPSGQDVKQVVVATKAGRLMALHAITAADKKADGSWRPIVIDNLPLIEKGVALTEIQLLLQLPSTRVKANIAVSYMTQFQSKPVVDLSQRSVPADMISRQSVAQFGEVVGSFSNDTTAVYPNIYNSTSVRNLQTAKTTSSWTVGAGVMGTVTDIMGNVIDISGNAILEYQVFCTYVATTTGWARTMIHIG